MASVPARPLPPPRPLRPPRPLPPLPSPPSSAPPSPARHFIIAWVVFWVLLATVALQDHLRQGLPHPWKPLLWEGTSCLVTSVLAAALWRYAPRQDALLMQPWRWWQRPLLLLPLAAPLFVVVVFPLRHGLHALIGVPYRHGPWPEVLWFESIKFAIFYLLFAAIFFGLRSYAAMQAERVRAEAERTAAREAQLAQLAQQIEPHFLFNALNTAAAAVHDEPARAEQLLLQLASLLRAATDMTRRPLVTVAEELQLLEAYASIMGQRFGERVQFFWQVDAGARDCRVPALLVQPLLENAFRHGVEKHPGAAQIDITFQRLSQAAGAARERLRIEVSCNLGRLDEAEGAGDPFAHHLHAAPAAEGGVESSPNGRMNGNGIGTPSTGVGLANLRRRLELAFAGEATFTLSARPEGGVLARLELPCAC